MGAPLSVGAVQTPATVFSGLPSKHATPVALLASNGAIFSQIFFFWT